jgi:hypothetical protein
MNEFASCRPWSPAGIGKGGEYEALGIYGATWLARPTEI